MMASNAALKRLMPILYGVVRTWKIINNTVMNIPGVWREQHSPTITSTRWLTDVNVFKVIQD